MIYPRSWQTKWSYSQRFKGDQGRLSGRKYELGFLRLKKWAECNGVGRRHILPAQVFSVALYVVSLIQTASTPAPVITAFYAMKCVHEIWGINSPTESKKVTNGSEF